MLQVDAEDKAPVCHQMESVKFDDSVKKGTIRLSDMVRHQFVSPFLGSDASLNIFKVSFTSVA
jgi:hypothetical protein